jgi:site-specific DNA-methyltransferase (adenine-specific)
MKPYYERAGVSIYNGDALDVLDALGDIQVDAVVMDPPYASGTRTEMGKSSSGAMLRGGRFSDRPLELDQMTTQGFVWLMRAIANGVRPVLPDGGSILSFIDWRQWPNLVGAMETCNYRVQGMVVWDKGSIGMGKGFRRQHELVCHASKGTPRVHDAGVGDVLTYARVRPEHHPSPKPPELLQRLLSVVSAPGETVLDPFMGSGTTLRAAKDLGRKAIGIEIEERYCEIAANRLAQEALPFGGEK